MTDLPERDDRSESVLSRWSRLKRGASVEKTDSSVNTISDASPQLNQALTAKADDRNVAVAEPLSSERSGAPEARGDNVSPPLPSLDEISLEGDFTPFMQAKVPEVLKRQALKTLFKDPHFNTMDGLDTYIDDYTKFEPISTAELDGLSAWKSISKPLEQVVTPGGYAVDVESEEGRAVLAARAGSAPREASVASTPEEDTLESVEASAVDTTDHTETAEPMLPQTTAASRYGKRVGDFKFVDTPLATESDGLPRPTPLPARALADDPR